VSYPPPPPRQSGGGNRWLLACGVGCGALVLLVVLAMIAGFVTFRTGMSEMATALQEEIVNEYERLQSEEKIPTEHAALFQRLFEVSQVEEASISAVFMSFFVLIGYLDDGEVTEAEADSATKLVDFLEANPSVGVFALAEFVGQNPEFEQTFRDVERAFENYDPNSGFDYEPEPAVDDANAPAESTEVEPEVATEPEPL
jgi:hypothetical protein